MVARAFAKSDQYLLLLDEPSSNLDPFAEHGLLKAFADKAREARLTLIVVSHRYGTVQFADTIVVMADGRVAEQGSHRELLARGGKYASSYSVQQAAHT